ncbi:unnamed protein product, partial [Adineta steineri]
MTKETADLTVNEQKVQINSASSTNAAHNQTTQHQQQPNDVMSMLQQLLQKQDQLLEENRKLKSQVEIQQVTINSLSEAVETLHINLPPQHDSISNPSTDATPEFFKEKFSLQQQAAKQLQSKRIDQLLNSTPFSGTMVQEVTDWLEEFNAKCDKLHFDDTRRLSVAVDLLKGNAKLWYDTHKEGIDNWKTFTDKLTIYFQLVTGTDQFQLEQKLYNRRRQHYESAIDYCHNVLKLCSKVNKDMSEEKRIKHLIQGLNPNARLHMDLKKPSNTEEFLEALIKFDKWQMEEQNQQRTQTSSDQRQYTSTKPSSQTYSPVLQQQTSKNYQPSYDQKQHNSNGKEYDGCWSCGEIRDGRISVPQFHPSLIIINTVINGKSTYAMVDTGATTSLISRSELNTIPHSSIQPTDTTATLGDGRTQISINGLVELAITINNITTCIKALIVESLGANIILGMDWCKLNNVKVNIHQNQIEITHPQYGNTTTPFINDGSVDACLDERVALLPYHEHIVKMQTPISSAMLAIFLPDFKKCSKLKIEIPDAFVEIKDFSFYITIFNPTTNVHTLDSKLKLGSIYYQSNTEIMYNVFETSKPSNSATPCVAINAIEVNEPPQLPSTPIVDNILQELVAHIHDEQHRKDFLKILHDNKRSFDTSKMTRATTKIHHTINTGDHPPVNVRPYYKTVQQRKELQEE